MDFTCSKLYCVKCGRRGIDIIRKGNQQREPGHLKKMYCIYDREETNHAEVRPFYSDYNYEDFLLEYNNHNFDESGNRIMPYRQFRRQIEVLNYDR